MFIVVARNKQWRSVIGLVVSLSLVLVIIHKKRAPWLGTSSLMFIHLILGWRNPFFAVCAVGQITFTSSPFALRKMYSVSKITAKVWRISSFMEVWRWSLQPKNEPTKRHFSLFSLGFRKYRAVIFLLLPLTLSD